MYKRQISLLKLNFGSPDLLRPFMVRLKDERKNQCFISGFGISHQGAPRLASVFSLIHVANQF